MKTRIKVDDAEIKKFNEEQIDWTASCKKCHVNLTGTLSELRGHVCGK